MTRAALVPIMLFLCGCIEKKGASVPVSWESQHEPLPAERILVFDEKPVFKEHHAVGGGGYRNLVIGQGDSGISMASPGEAPEPSKLPEEKVLRLEVIEIAGNVIKMGSDEPMKLPTSYELSKVMDGQQVLYDASLCRPHGLKMERKAVKISYGLPGFPEGFREASGDFPNDGRALGGCCPMPELTHSRQWVCGKCETLSKKWWKENLEKR